MTHRHFARVQEHQKRAYSSLMWLLAACLSALFAGLTSVLAKAGVATTSSTVATALRTVVVAAGAWGMAALVGSASSLGTIDGRSLLFLILSGLATGASWLCYFAALARGDVSRVAPIDKLSTVLACERLVCCRDRCDHGGDPSHGRPRRPFWAAARPAPGR